MPELLWAARNSIKDITSPKLKELESMTRFTGLITEPVTYDVDVTPKPVFEDLDSLNRTQLQRKLDAFQAKMLEDWKGGGYTGRDDRTPVGTVHPAEPNHTAPQRGTLTFYRVEDSQRRGPYRYEVDYPLTNGRSHHPLPEQDGLDWWKIPNHPDYYFGFADMADLLGWFDPEALSRLISARNQDWGFRVTHYTVEVPENIIHGYRQAIAKRPDLRYCETIDIRSLI